MAPMTNTLLFLSLEVREAPVKEMGQYGIWE